MTACKRLHGKGDRQMGFPHPERPEEDRIGGGVDESERGEIGDGRSGACQPL